MSLVLLQEFTTLLEKFCNANKSFEVVVFSSDRSQEDYTTWISKLPPQWLTVADDTRGRAAKATLGDRFKVTGTQTYHVFVVKV